MIHSKAFSAVEKTLAIHVTIWHGRIKGKSSGVRSTVTYKLVVSKSPLRELNVSDYKTGYSLLK